MRFGKRFTSSSVARPRSCKATPTARSASSLSRSRSSARAAARRGGGGRSRPRHSPLSVSRPCARGRRTTLGARTLYLSLTADHLAPALRPLRDRNAVALHSASGSRLHSQRSDVALSLHVLRPGHTAEFSGDDDLVFCTAAGRPRRPNSVLRAFQRAAKRAGLEGNGRPRLRVHDCRHTFVSRCSRPAATSCSSRARWATHRQQSRSIATRTCSMPSATPTTLGPRSRLRSVGSWKPFWKPYPRQPPATATVSAGAEVLAIPLR